MQAPDERLFEADLVSAEFRIGAAKGQWGEFAVETLAAALKWPARILWIAAPPRPNAPGRFHLLLNLEGYRSVPPTGAFWNPDTQTALPKAQWPKGKDNSRFAKVFRTDWKEAVAFYHPYDRVAANDHAQWPTEQPHLIWTANHTIVDYLEEIHSLFKRQDYLGI
jgi:hypothetical protein